MSGAALTGVVSRRLGLLSAERATLVGLSLTLALAVTNSLGWMVRAACPPPAAAAAAAAGRLGALRSARCGADSAAGASARVSIAKYQGTHFQ